MKYLIKKARIVTESKVSAARDILIERGKIIKIAKSIDEPKAIGVESKNLHVTLGFCDIGAFIGEPGYEERETVSSVISAANHGGYTHIAPFPNSNPVVDNKSGVRFLIQAFNDSTVSVHPIGAISKGVKGSDIAEMIDMATHGALAFSDGKQSIQDTGLLLRALQYGKTINTTIIQHPSDSNLASDHMIHEGAVSTSLGLPGIPSESESIMMKRDIDIAGYAEARLCMHNISTKKSVDLVKKAKKKNKPVSTSVAVMNLIHEDNALLDFDPNYKVLPPLREKTDRNALIRGVKNGLIDYISSNHRPLDRENKDLEFARSAFGASTLDTVFSSLRTYLKDELSLIDLVNMLSYGPRKVLGLPISKIEEGEPADLVLFDPSMSWKVNSSNILSRSKNNPYIGQELQGKICGVIHNNKAILYS